LIGCDWEGVFQIDKSILRGKLWLPFLLPGFLVDAPVKRAMQVRQDLFPSDFGITVISR